MEILLETNNSKEIINFIESRLEDEFFSLIGMYECSIPEMDYWIKSEIIDRLSDSFISLTGWENKSSEWYDNLLTEDLVERISEGDVVMYVDSNDSAEYWCEDNGYEYEFVEPR
jgi:hypothetical protein